MTLELNANSFDLTQLQDGSVDSRDQDGDGLVDGIPSGLSASGTVGHGNTLTITDGNARFGWRTNLKPLYVNMGDGKPGSSLGRDTADYFNDSASYQTTFNVGQIPGGVSLDHDQTSSALFNKLFFNPDKPLIQYIERYRDYDITTDQRMRVVYTGKSGTISPGDTITGQTSGATGVVRTDDGNGIDFEVGSGTIRSGGATFQNGETMTGPSGSVVNAETDVTDGVEGMQTTFNLKCNRNWAGSSGGINNHYYGWQGANTPTGAFRSVVEYATATDNSIYTNVDTLALPHQWNSDEFNFENSSGEGVEDGIGQHYRGPTPSFGEPGIVSLVTFDSSYPNKINRAYLDQVSNGVGTSAATIAGYQCWDDEYAGVYIGDAATRSNCTYLVRQPQVNWSETKIEIQQVESVVTLTTGYVYVRTGRENWVSDTGIDLGAI